MTLNNRNVLCWMLAAVLLAGCATRGNRAPILERGASARKSAPASVQRDQDGRPRNYVIQKGDTLYSIAFNYGLDYHEIAELNGIQNPDIIHIGQEIHLLSDSAAPVTKTVPEARPVIEKKSLEPSIKDQPVAMKLSYSEKAVAQIAKMQDEALKAKQAAASKVNTETRIESKSESFIEGNEAVPEWGLPANGKLIGQFSESENRKGIDIAGKLGQPVIASAAGRVVYSGSGLRGYGKLVIVKHNKTYLSAYAHNNLVLVKEGQSVVKGQKIAEMGNTDTDQVKLHFEIRKFGQPVDPAQYLPL